MLYSDRAKEAKAREQKVDCYFTVAQLDYLRKLFPQRVLGTDQSESAMRMYFGQQSVLSAVKARTRGLHESPDNV